MDKNVPQNDTLYLAYDRSLYKITPESAQEGLINQIYARGDANNSTMVNVPSDLASSGQGTAITNVTNGGYSSGKEKWSDVKAGFFLGIDVDSIAKLNIGNETSYLKWDGESLSILGTLNIGGTVITIDNTQNVQNNLNLIASMGGGTLYLQMGTYTLTSDLSIPSSVTIAGVSRDNVIINCNLLYKIIITGSNPYNTGTVSITKGTSAVTGAGTTWTSVMIGQNIQLYDFWYTIVAVTDGQHLTIEMNYKSASLAGSRYMIATINNNAKIETITITNATGTGLKVQYALEPVMRDVFVYGCGTGIELAQTVYATLLATSNDNGTNCSFLDTYGFEINFSALNDSSSSYGLVMSYCGGATIFDSEMNGNLANGVNMSNTDGIAFMSVNISNNTGDGLNMTTCNYNSFSSTTIQNNTANGAQLVSNCNRNAFSATSPVTNGAYGIKIANANCNSNVLVAPTYFNNVSGTLSDAGTTTKIL